MIANVRVLNAIENGSFCHRATERKTRRSRRLDPRMSEPTVFLLFTHLVSSAPFLAFPLRPLRQRSYRRPSADCSFILHPSSFRLHPCTSSHLPLFSERNNASITRMLCTASSTP